MTDTHILTFQFDYNNVVDLLFSAKQRVIWATVNLFEEAAQSLAEVRKRNIPVTVILDLNEDAYRNGFGDIGCINILEKVGCEIRELPRNRVSFLIVDESGYFLFNQSRILEEEGNGMNAVRIDPVLCERLLLEYLPPQNVFEATPRLERLKRLTQQATEQMSQIPSIVDRSVGNPGAQPVNKQQFQKTAQALLSNPPIHPDVKRQMNVYTNKFQYVELEFTGANFEQIQIDIPNSILPFKDARLKNELKARLPLFENPKEFPEQWTTIKQEVDELRKEFLVKSKKANKSVLSVNRKAVFQGKIKDLKKRIEEARDELITHAENESINTRKRIKIEILTFFKANPPDKLIRHKDRPDFDEMLHDEAVTTAGKINFPDLSKRLGKVELHERYADIAWEDLEDETFRQELYEKGLITTDDINQLSTLERALGARK